ncbi:MAG: aldehyde dehydrogenase family protein [Bacteriovoracales bacterium]|nr:aldehyde dehydrogenase family protein [Bacteriovoracales bacterium]
MIDGKTVQTQKPLEVFNPADGSLVGIAPRMEIADINRAVEAATHAFSSWRETTLQQRRKACLAIAKKIGEHSEELAQLLTLEQGKPLGGLGSRWEIGGAVTWTQYTAGLSLPTKILQDNEEGRVEFHRKPIGVVGSITPWNFPVLIGIWHIIPAVMTGNTVICKPSPFTPLVTLKVVELINQILPKGVVNCVTGEDEIGAAMATHPGIGKIVFTGSCATGRKVMASAAETMKRLTLELGGNDAGIVLDDVDPKQIAEGLFWGAFINSGQTCAALKRLYISDRVHDAICKELVQFARKMPMGVGTEPGTMLGPIQNLRQYQKIENLAAEAIEKGTLLLGGKPDKKGKGHFFPITIVTDLDNGDRLVDEEQFGPVLPIIKFSNIEEALAKANDNPNGLGGSVWSRDIERARQIAGRMECGSVWINKHGMIQPNAPFGGMKSSGIGVEFGEEGLAEYTNIQVIFS